MSPRRDDLPILRRQELAPDPFDQFGAWWELAQEQVPLAESMTLATAGEDGVPDARMVLLKGFGPDGFRFFSNYDSVKGGQLAATPAAALILYWRELDRQVRARGPVQRLSAEESDAYFASRPRESRLAASISAQSRPVESREELERLYDEAESRLDGEEVPRPPHWGGYLLAPEAVEFWQGRPGRLHDRFRYTRADGGWRIDRLAP